MNLKANKDIFNRVVKNFACVIAIGAMVLLIAIMLFAESIHFSKEVFGLVIGTAFLFSGIGGIVSAATIFFSYCMKKITKLEKVIAEKDKTISTQRKQLKEAYSSKNAAPQVNRTHDIFEVLEPLSEDSTSDETIDLDESCPEFIPPLNPTAMEDA